MRFRALKIYALVIVFLYALIMLSANLVIFVLALPIIFDLASSLLSFKKDQKLDQGLKIYSFGALSLYMISWMIFMIDYLLFGRKSDYFGYGIGVFMLLLITPITYGYAKDVFGENRVVKNIFFILMFLFLFNFAYEMLRAE
jgi:hypothetical protein